jgi:hypothetical protein
METSTPVPKKKRGPPPTGWGHQLSVRLREPEMARLDAWIDRQPEPKPSRPEALRRLANRALANEGVAAGGNAASIPIEDLNASNDE